jgi:hypothetical protein
VLHAEDFSVIDVIKQQDGIAYINPALLKAGQTAAGAKLDPGLKDLIDSVL